MATSSWEFKIQSSEFSSSITTGYHNYTLIGTRMSGVNADVRKKIPKFATINSATCAVSIKATLEANAYWQILKNSNMDISKTLWSSEGAITGSYKRFTRDVLEYIDSDNENSGVASSIYCLAFRAKSPSSIIGRIYTCNEYRIMMTFTYPTITVKGNVNNADYGEVVSSTHTLNTPIDIGASGVWTPQTCTIEAKPKSGYRFIKWSDGNTSPTRNITLSEDVLSSHNTVFTYTAEFEKIPVYTLIVNASDGGMVGGGGSYLEGTDVTIAATPNIGYSFQKWDDGSTDNPRTVTVTSNVTYTALFEIKRYSITTKSVPGQGGTIDGGGTYNYGTVQLLTAYPATGYRFVSWEDGNPSNPRQVVISEDSEGAIYTAVFELIVYDIPAYGQNGLVETHGERKYNTTVVITATPHTGYRFVKWSDGELSPNRFLVLTSDIIDNIPSYVAEFEAVDLSLNTIDKIGDNALTNGIITRFVDEFIDNNAIRIGDFAFYNCSDLTFVHVKKVKRVGAHAFDNCAGLLSVEIPLSTTGLGEYAFSNCVNLNALILPAASVVALTNSNTLNNTAIALGYGHIYVPHDLLTAYREETNWGQYADAFRAIEDYPELCSLKLT